MKLETLFRFIFSSVLVATSQLAANEAANNWHQWRGPEANGVSRTAKPPLEWSEEKNVKWKVAIDGSGGSTPIIWDNQVFLLTAINTGKVDPSLPNPEDQPKRVFDITYPMFLRGSRFLYCIEQERDRLAPKRDSEKESIAALERCEDHER